MVRWLITAALAIVAGVFCMQPTQAQNIVRHQSPVALERGAVNRITFDVTGLNRADYRQASFFYRYDGDFSYQQEEIEFENGSFVLPFRVDNATANSIEYYLEVELASGQTLTFPEVNPAEDPVQVEIVDTAEEELPRLEGIDFNILSPQPGNALREEDVLVAMVLFYDKAAIPEGEFRLMFDDTDVTAQADTSDYYLSYRPESVPRGSHTITLQYQTSAQTYVVTEWDFVVVAAGQASFQGFETASNMPAGRVELTARNQVVAGDVNNAYTGRTNISGEYGKLRYSVNGYLTSQESSRLQPQNRYGINLRVADWWMLEAGHVYPTLSNFTISGRRMHGVHTRLSLLGEAINFQFLHGELDRKITNLYDQLVIEEETSASGTVVDTSYTLQYQQQGRGTFQRQITGGSIDFGNPNTLQFGLHALKIQDDTTSLTNIRDYNSLVDANTGLGSALSEADREKLQNNPNLLQVQGGSVRPRDNFVAGGDLKFGFHQNRIRFESEAVMSALNDDIYGGPFTVERAEDMGFDISQSEADLLDRLSWLIIVNENMNTIPLRIKEDENGEDQPEPFFPTSILAANSEVSARYSRNTFRLQYRWIGPNFNSLANSTVRKDVAGFTLSDRMNLLSNRIYLTLGFETLQDNVVGNRDATTHTNTYRTNISWYPVNRDLPRVTAGFRYRTRDNGVERQNFEVYSPDVVKAAVRNQRINADGDTVATAFPRLNNTINLNTSVTQQFSLFDVRHDASLNLSNMHTTDEVFAYGDVQNTAFSLNLNSRFPGIGFQSQLGVSYNDTESGSGQSQISILGMYAGGDYVMLQGKMSLNGRVAVTLNESSFRNLETEDEGDDNPANDYYVLSDQSQQRNFNTFVVQAGAEYRITDYHALHFSANFTNVSRASTANDRIVQLRYIFSF